MSAESAPSWYDDAPITDEQYASVWDSAMAVQERPSYSRHVVRKLLAEIDRLRIESAYMREQIEQQAQVIEERKMQAVAYRAVAEEHQKRGNKLSAQLAEIGETRTTIQFRACQSPDGPLIDWTDLVVGQSIMITPWPDSAGRIRLDFRQAQP